MKNFVFYTDSNVWRDDMSIKSFLEEKEFKNGHDISSFVELVNGNRCNYGSNAFSYRLFSWMCKKNISINDVFMFESCPENDLIDYARIAKKCVEAEMQGKIRFLYISNHPFVWFEQHRAFIEQSGLNESKSIKTAEDYIAAHEKMKNI